MACFASSTRKASISCAIFCTDLTICNTIAIRASGGNSFPRLIRTSSGVTSARVLVAGGPMDRLALPVLALLPSAVVARPRPRLYLQERAITDQPIPTGQWTPLGLRFTCEWLPLNKPFYPEDRADPTPNRNRGIANAARGSTWRTRCGRDGDRRRVPTVTGRSDF